MGSAAVSIVHHVSDKCSAKQGICLVMNDFFNPINLFSDKVEESTSSRQHLREKLGLIPFLEKRKSLILNEEIHCELYHHSDEAPVILFLPGIGTYCELYAELLSGVCDQGFNVVGIDLRGHGYSAGIRGDYRVDQVIEDITAVIDHLSPQYSGSVGIYGYSIGGLLAVAAAERDDRIDSVLCGTLLLTEIAPDLIHQFGWTMTWSSALFFPQMKVPMKTFIDYEQLLAGHPAAAEISNDPRIVYDYPLGTLASLFTHSSGVMKNCYQFKAAIIHGEHDEVLPLSYSREVIKAMKHPFELIELEGEGHMIPWDNPDLLISEVSQWFTKTL